MVEGIVCWNENCVSSTSEEFQSHPLADYVNQENERGIQGFEQCSISKRMRLSPEFTLQEIWQLIGRSVVKINVQKSINSHDVKLDVVYVAWESTRQIPTSPKSGRFPEGDVDSAQESSPLGLKLRKTPSFLNLLEMKLSQWRKEDCSPKSNPKMGRQNSKTKVDEKLKATNFAAILLRIGNWQWISGYEGDLTAKIYYGKHKMVWEVLSGALKSKIEIQWSNITAIRAIIHDNEPGILEIELNQTPLFFRETNPQPRKHTLWRQTLDFTGGQASIFRTHHVSFAPGMLDKHFEKLLQCDQRLFSLSQKTFPSQESPYFDSAVDGGSKSFFTLNGYESEFLLGMQYPHRTYPAPFVLENIENFKTMTTSPIRLIAFDEKVRNYRCPNQRQRVWADRENADWDDSQADYVPSPLDYVPMEDVGGFSPNRIVLNDVENPLLEDNQFVYSNEEKMFTNVKLMCPWVEPLNVNPVDSAVANQLHINHQINDTQVIQNTFENSVPDGIDSEPMTWLNHQDPNESLKMEPTTNNSLYQYMLPIKDFSTPNVMQNIHSWA